VAAHLLRSQTPNQALQQTAGAWNSNKAFPRGGHYRLDLGSNPRQTITVYVDGNTYTVAHVDGDTRVDIQL
jgi:hypothetical protein